MQQDSKLNLSGNNICSKKHYIKVAKPQKFILMIEAWALPYESSELKFWTKHQGVSGEVIKDLLQFQ